MSDAATPSAAFPSECLLAQAAWVRRLAGRLLADPDAADDLAQETLVRALTAAPADPERPRGWLATIARRLAGKEREQARARVAREQLVASAVALPSAAELVARAAVQRAVVDAVLALPEPYRSTVLLRFFEEVPTSEIARRRGEPIETVRTRLKRGLAQLRERLAGELDVETNCGGRYRGLAALALFLQPVKPAVEVATAATSATATATSAALAATTTAGAMVMATKAKLVAAAVVVAAGAWVGYEIRGASHDDALVGRRVDGDAPLATQPPRIPSVPVASRIAAPAEVSSREVEARVTPASDAPSRDTALPPGFTTATMDALTSFDEAAELEAMVAGLLLGDAELGDFPAFSVRIVEAAVPIPVEPRWSEGVKRLGKARWFAYRDDDDSLCRARISRHTSGDGDEVKTSLSLPIRSNCFVTVPPDLKDAEVTISILRQSGPHAIVRGTIEIDLLPDYRRMNGIEPIRRLTQFKGDELAGVVVEFFGSKTTPLGFVRRKAIENLPDGNFASVDVDWDRAIAIDPGVVAKLDELSKQLARRIDE